MNPLKRHAGLVGTVSFEVPNNAIELVLHIFDIGKGVAIPIKMELDQI